MKRAKLLIFALAFGTFSILNTEVGILGILPLIAKHFDVSVSSAGLFVSLFALIVAISGIVMPSLLSGFDRTKVMLLTLFVFVLSNIGAGFAPSFGWAMVARLVPAFFHPVYCSLAFTVAVENVEPEESSKAVSLVIVGVSSGMVLGTPLTTLIANNFSYQTAMYCAALISLLAFLLNKVVLRKVSTQNTTEQIELQEIKHIIGKKVFWISGVGTMLIGGALFTFYGYISDYLSKVSHFSATNLSLALLIFGLGSIVGNLVAGNLLASRPKVIITVYPFLLAGTYIAIMLFGQANLVMFVLVAIWGFFYGIGNNIQQYLISSAIPEALDLANGLFIALGNIGTTLGTSLGGAMLGMVGITSLPIGGVVVVIIVLIFALWRNKLVKLELNDTLNVEN